MLVTFAVMEVSVSVEEILDQLPLLSYRLVLV